jgi:uncharacterized membrane protein YgcG
MGLVLALATGVASALTPLPEQLGHVSDLAGVMSSDVTLHLGGVLSDYAADTGIRIAVLTIDEVDGETAEDCAGRALEIWQTEDSAQRSVLLLWTGQGQVVIYVGEGLRDQITDAESQLVINESVIPSAAIGSVDQAMMLGAYRLIEMANGTSGASEPPPGDAVQQGIAEFPLLGGAREALLQDLQILASSLAESPAGTASWFATSAQAQAHALPSTLPANLARLPGSMDAMAFFIAAVVGLLFVVNVAWRITRAPAALACALAMAGAVLLWLLTRFTELSLLVLLAGPLAWIAWILWRRRAQQGAQTVPVPTNAYAAWLATQQKHSAPRPSAAGTAPAAAKPPAARPGPTTSSASAQTKLGPGQLSSGQLGPAQQRLADMLERMHGAGVATPALDRVLTRWRTITSAQYKQHRTGMLVIFIVLAVFFLPLAFAAAVVWIVSELNALKQPNQKLGEFFQQLSQEVQAAQRPQSRR